MAPSKIKILIVDDEKIFCQILKERLERENFDVTVAHTGEEALEKIEKVCFQVAVLDIILPDISGLELLKKIKSLNLELEVIMLTANGNVEDSIEAIKLGAFEYLTKPCNITELEFAILKAVEKRRLVKKVNSLEKMVSKKSEIPALIGESKEIKKIRSLIEKVADSDAPVLILGESGSGKDLVAELLHYKSIRRDYPYQVLNSASLSYQLLESELFGHKKGAFTGAVDTKEGLAEAADGGTLFLDEIADMHLDVQPKFLRFLETGEFRRLGENKLRTVDVRVVAATNKDLKKCVEEGTFREDLYFRLNVIVINIPPLRERKEDIIPLADYFLKMKSPGKEKVLTDEAKELLLRYKYPGNVRELANIIERGILLSGDSKYIDPQHLYLECVGVNELEEEDDLCLSLKEVEKRHIKKVLKNNKNNKTKAAKILGIGLRTLYRKVEEYNINI